jgi:general secretion pathway protein D
MTRNPFGCMIGIVAALALTSLPAIAAQNGDGQPNERDERGRRILEGPDTVLAFRNVSIDQLVPFIVESTGKVVLPQSDVLTRRITILNDRPIARQRALDLVFLALQQEGIAVVETYETITLRDISEIDKQDVPVLGPDESVLDRRDYGTIVEKVFRLENSTAEAMGELLEDGLPDYAKLTVDEESNQVAVMGNIALLQRLENLISSLDQNKSDAVRTETFRLRFADAEDVKTNIEELFTASTGSGSSAGGGNQRGQVQRFGGRGGQQAGNQQTSANPSENMRVTANAQQNSVTVVAEPSILENVRQLIEESWDVEVDAVAVTPRVYDLSYSDPIKVADALTELFDNDDAGRLAGQFSFQALEASNQLVVLTKSPDNLTVIDEMIAEIDQPLTVGLPAIVELKHTSAEEVAEQLNTLLAQDGTIAQLPRSEEGLSEGSSNISPFADTAADNQQNNQDQADIIQFWWQRSRPPTDERSPSNLISQIRIVPVWRQNALMVLAPPEYKASVVELIGQLDQPGRQVMISAIIAQVSKDDSTALGFRWSSDAINLQNSENSIAIGVSSQASEGDFLGNLFDTSILNVNADLNVVLQALAQNTGVNILSEPRVFTSDNQEASFFDGQDIAFPVSVQTFDTGATTVSTEYRAVGIQLRARPRITPGGDVDLRVNLQLSSIAPGVLANGSVVVDRREATTQLIVRNGETIVISGIIESEDVEIIRKVPILGDIPILSLFFKSTEKTKVQSELIFFITPIIVENTQDLHELNQPDLDQLQQQREGLQGAKKNNS